MEGLIVDNFAGGGGASTGIEAALGRDIDIAINHSPQAIAMHEANHPRTRHLCEDVWQVDPAKACAGRPVDLAWFSPDCTHFSRAKGGKPRSKKTRALAWVVIRWARAVRPSVIMLENVEEFLTWGPLGAEGQPDPKRAGRTFKMWLGKLRALGYKVEWRSLVAADYGAPTTRRRLFLIARCDGQPIVWPTPTHGRHGSRPWRSAAEVIDFSVPCPSIFDRKKPLADATQRRIAAGLRRYVLECPKPFVVPLTHHGERRTHPLDEPLPTITAANRGELALITPFVSAQVGQSVGRGVEAPLPTIAGGGMGHQALIAPTLIQTGYGEREGQAPRALDIGKPLGTLVSGGKHAAAVAFLAKHYGGPNGHQTSGQSMTSPMGTVTAQDHHSVVGVQLGLPIDGHARTDRTAEVHAFLIAYYGSEREGQQLGLPLRTIPTRDRFGLVVVEGVEYQITDIGMRMLLPEELFRAQSFPREYVIAAPFKGRTLNKTEQIELAGNSVCPVLSEALVRANCGRRIAAAEVA